MSLPYKKGSSYEWLSHRRSSHGWLDELLCLSTSCRGQVHTVGTISGKDGLLRWLDPSGLGWTDAATWPGGVPLLGPTCTPDISWL